MHLNASRSRNSIFNAISAMLLTLVNGLLGIVVTRFVIEHFGSDFNGLNSTANQIVNVLLVLEGGFTMASNVALFSPLTQENYNVVNGVLAATRKNFRKIGLIFIGIGSLVAVGYGFAANSALPVDFIATVIFMTVVPAAFNLFYATTYRVLLQTQQKEYVISLITACTISLGHICNIVMINKGGPMWVVRFITMCFALLNSVFIAGYVKRKNPFLNLNCEPKQSLIKGTGDVMAQKITGVIYNSAPIVFLSVSPSGGTALASVYAVYNNIFTMLKSLLHGVIDAPRLSFGQILTQRKREEVWHIYAQYEYAAFMAVFLMLTTCSVLILPFIRLYTAGIGDADYYDLLIAVLMLLIAAFEMIHIPSGHLINMAGQFHISRNFQIISCVVLLLTMTVGGIFWGIYGMLCALLTVAVLLTILEMGYIHTRFFPGKVPALLKLLLPLILVGAATCFVEMQLPIKVNSYLMFAFYGLIFVVLNGLIALAVGMLFNRKELMAILKRVFSIVRRK